MYEIGAVPYENGAHAEDKVEYGPIDIDNATQIVRSHAALMRLDN